MCVVEAGDDQFVTESVLRGRTQGVDFVDCDYSTLMYSQR